MYKNLYKTILKRQKLEIIHKSINSWISKMRYIDTEFDTGIKRNEILIMHATPWMNLENNTK